MGEKIVTVDLVVKELNVDDNGVCTQRKLASVFGNIEKVGVTAKEVIDDIYKQL